MMAVLTLATIGIAGYLLQAHYSGGSVVCATGGCEAVEQSRYSEVFGVPVSLFGLIGSAAILITLVRSDMLGRAACLTLTVTGIIFAAYLALVQLAVLNAVCEWCIVNDSLIAALAVLAALRAAGDLKHAPLHP